MIYAKRIKMKQGCRYSQNLLEIDMIYLEGEVDFPGYYKKEIIHDFLKENPGTIAVWRNPYPSIIPARSSRGEKYVRSSPNGFTRDNLLDLPRE